MIVFNNNILQRSIVDWKCHSWPLHFLFESLHFCHNALGWSLSSRLTDTFRYRVLAPFSRLFSFINFVTFFPYVTIPSQFYLHLQRPLPVRLVFEREWIFHKTTRERLFDNDEWIDSTNILVMHMHYERINTRRGGWIRYFDLESKI